MAVRKAQNYLFEEIDPLLRLSEVEEVLRKSKVIMQVWCRKTLIEMCEDGTLRSTFFRGQYLVYESSVIELIESFQIPKKKAA